MPLRIDFDSLGVGTSHPGGRLGQLRSAEANNSGAGTSIPLSSDGAVNLLIQIPAVSLDLLWIQEIGAKVSGVDASGQLSLIGMDFSVYSNVANVTPGTFQNLPLNFQPPPILSMPKIAGQEISLAVVAPGPIYRRSLDTLQTPAIVGTDRFIVAAALVFRNADGAGAHSAFAALDMIFRIIHGGDFT